VSCCTCSGPEATAPPHIASFTDKSAEEHLTDAATPRRYADHVGIHYVLCSKLRQFAYEELEFFLPQYVAARMTRTRAHV
jgi:hypothetical protein